MPPFFTRLLCALLCCLGFAAKAAEEAKDYSAAERLLFMSPQLKNVQPPATLGYSFRRSGTLEEAFDDRVTLALARQNDGTCCTATAEFLSGPRKLPLPEVPAAEGNPVTLYFLERDVREMQRLTKGQQNHFRKRIRMAVYNGATVRPVTLGYRGSTVAASEITISPYLDDPNRPRYDKLAVKQYRFVLSDAVPGGVVSIRTQIAGPDAAASPLLVEELTLDGAEPPPPSKP
jgi:hypothetical protein